MTEQNNPAGTEVPPPVAMLQMIASFWISLALYIAAKLGLPDLVADGPKSAEELAAATGTHAPSLQRVLRALASVGVFARTDEGRFALTPLAATLRSDVPGSLRAFATVELGEEHYPAWGDLLHSVRTGEIAFDHHFGMPVWEFFERHPENAATFNDAMTGLTDAVNGAVLESYDFSPFRKIVDVGGGHGRLLAAVLSATPRAKGILFDAPSVVAGSPPIETGLAGRVEKVAGDFFQSVPAGADAYLLKWIIHDWDDERSVAILKNCRNAMAEGGRVILVEAVLPLGDEPHFGKFIDLNMLVMTGGRERTEEEYRTLLEAAGLRLTRVVPTPSAMSVVEAERR